MASALPIGLICCFGLVLFLIVSSIVLALIPIYLPTHGSDIQHQSNQDRIVYIEYSGTANDGLTGFVSNLDDINKQYKNQLGFEGNLLTIEKIQVIHSPAPVKRRRYLLRKNSLKRRKRATDTFRVLFIVRITFSIMCQSDLCQVNILAKIKARVSERATFTVEFTFISFTNGPIEYFLTFISFTFTIPPGFLGSEQSSSTTIASMLTTASTLTNTGTATLTNTGTATNQELTTSESEQGQTTVNTIVHSTTSPSVTGNIIDFTGSTTLSTIAGTGTTTSHELTLSESEQGSTTAATRESSSSVHLTTSPSVTGDLIDLTGSTTLSTIIATITGTRSYSTASPSVTGDLIDLTGSPTSSPTTSQSNTQCDESVREGLKWFGSYNLITLGDFSTTSVVENRTIVCGSILSSQSATFASDVGQNLYSPLNYTLQLNGNIVQGNPLQVNQGSFGVGTNPSHSIARNTSVQYTLDGRQININDGNNGAILNVDNNLSDTCQSITSSLIELSGTLAQLTNTSGNVVSIPTTQSGPLNFYVNSINNNGISVFNLDGNTVLNNNLVQQIELIVSSSISSNLELVIINLLGTTISFNQGNLVGDWFNSEQTGQSHTIWNLPQATTLTINRSWLGSLLAPYANVTNTVQIDGATAVYSLSASAGINNPSIILPNCV